MVFHSLGGGQTHTHTNMHIDVRTKVISRNQAHAWFNNHTNRPFAYSIAYACFYNSIHLAAYLLQVLVNASEEEYLEEEANFKPCRLLTILFFVSQLSKDSLILRHA